MNWWTVEYGLMGGLDDPRLYGAGLLSSVGEARTCLGADVEKLPLDLECVLHGYDITEPQPRLFVTPDFEHLSTVLDRLAEGMAYRRGGTFGLDVAIAAGTVNTVALDSGLQISGEVESYLVDADGAPAYVRLTGPSQMARDFNEIPGHGTARHASGFSFPVGPLAGPRRSAADLTRADLRGLARLEFASGVVVEGQIEHAEFSGDRLAWLTWREARVTRGDDLLFDPAWGPYDMPVGLSVTSVFGGPADRAKYGDALDFESPAPREREYTPAERERFALYREIRDLRERNHGHFDKLVQRWLERPGDDWLIGLELREIAARKRVALPALERKLDPETRVDATTKLALQLGAQLIDR